MSSVWIVGTSLSHGLWLREIRAPSIGARLYAEGIFRIRQLRIDGYVVKHLVDANVLSERFEQTAKPTPDARAVAWLLPRRLQTEHNASEAACTFGTTISSEQY